MLFWAALASFVLFCGAQFAPCLSTSMLFQSPLPSGSLGCDSYGGDVDVQWNVSATSLTDYRFQAFSTKACCDILQVYDGASGVLLRGFGLRFRFTSDMTVSASGFRIEYSAPRALSYCFGSFNFSLSGEGEFGCQGFAPHSDIQWLFSSPVEHYFPSN